MNPVELIAKKRDGNPLSPVEIDFFIKNYTDGTIPDYQMSAMLMAIYLKGMNNEETASLTDCMLRSGKTAELSSIDGFKIGKHSTGGVGDKTTLILTPIVAAAGINVAQTTGRGLGHTGGTLDKLETIPGFRTGYGLDEFIRVIKECGAALTGQSDDIAPADRKLYALRDVTATVACIPLITSSIMSKKLAEGTDGLVLDIKTGSGAFMKSFEDANKLGELLVNTTKKFDKKVTAFITDMSQPLGQYIGNWFEVYESIEVLKGKKVPGLYELSIYLSAAMIHLAGKAESIEEGYEEAERIVESGEAFDKFVEITEVHSGDTALLHEPEKYDKAKYSLEVKSSMSGYLKEVDTYELGMTSLNLGAGRKTVEDKIDPTAGIIFYPMVGDEIKEGVKIAELFTNIPDALETAAERLKNALNISEEKVKAPELLQKIID